jgi:arylsulfatase
MPSRPNILFIFADQMRADCLSILGHPVVETPNLDQLGHRGVVFTAAYSCAPTCIATRASIFTGLSPSNTGRLGYRDQVPWRYPNMLAEVFSRAGYQTHCAGKTHFYPQRAHLGFQSMDSYEHVQNFDGTYVNDYWEWLAQMSNGRLHERDNGISANSWVGRPSHLPEELHNNSWVVAKGIDFLRRRDKTRPFFLFLSFHRPHSPLDPPQRYYDLYKDRPIPPVPVGDWAEVYDRPVDSTDAWCGHLPDHVLADSRRAYYAQIAHIDSQIGRILQAGTHLKVGPMVVLFSSDHGEMLGDHHLFRKQYAYEGSAKVPLILSMPGVPPAGFCDAPIVSEDVYPTLLEIAGIQIPGEIDGRSFLHLARDAKSSDRRPWIHGEHTGSPPKELGMQYLTDGREKYIWYNVSGQEQFFDLANDPQELHDLAPDPGHRERIEVWRRRMIAELAPRTQDGLSDGKQLIPGKALPDVRPELMET